MTESDYEELMRRLVEPVRALDVEALPTLVLVYCSTGRRHRRVMGSVRTSALGPVWVPKETNRLDDGGYRAYGSEPALLDADVAVEEHLAVFLDCPRHGSWTLSPAELIREWKAASRAKGVRDFAPTREVPTEWGPLVNDPKNWTDEEREEAVDAVVLWGRGEWPREGMAAVDRSKVEARMVTLLEEIARRRRA